MNKELIFTTAEGDSYIMTNDFIGGGGFGAVYIGYRIEINDKTYKRIDDKKYAIKSVLIKKPDNYDLLSKKKQEVVLTNLVDAIKSEINLNKHISSNPHCDENIVCFYGHFYNDFNRTFYIVMEYIEGDTLDKYKLTLQLLTDCVVTLDKLHRHGIIHRDIKPDNIMCTDDSKVKFIDLGIACSSIYKKKYIIL